MKCGERSKTVLEKNFSWVPPWLVVTVLIPILYIVLAGMLTKRMMVPVPFCAKHKGHWVTRALIAVGCLLLILGLLVLASLFNEESYGGILWGVFGVFCVSGIVGLVIFGRGTIRAEGNH